MALTKAQKQNILENLRDKVTRQKAIILVGIAGLKVKDISNLRKKLKTVDAELKVVKKTLVEIVFKENKLAFEKGKFKTEIALVFGYKDGILPAKTIYQSIKESENLKILGGYLENSFKEAEEIIELAKLPSREELLANLFFTAKSPIFALNNILQRNLSILKVKN